MKKPMIFPQSFNARCIKRGQFRGFYDLGILPKETADQIAALPKLLEALESLAKIGADGVIERRETGKPMWSAMDEIRKLTSASLLAAGYTNK